MPEKRTNDEVVDIIENEGLGYAIDSYFDADSIEDDVVASFWRIAKEAMDGIAERLRKTTGRDIDG